MEAPQARIQRSETDHVEPISSDNPIVVARDTPLFCHVEGTFYRAVDPAYRTQALSGSRNAGRYSSSKQPTLYLSSTPQGVEAAMIAHKREHATLPTIVQITVHAAHIFDLRSAEARSAAGVSLADAMAPWQDAVEEGQHPQSWTVRERLESLGCLGLIDPSRKAPGLWHLVLFSWGPTPPICVTLEHQLAQPASR